MNIKKLNFLQYSKVCARFGRLKSLFNIVSIIINKTKQMELLVFCFAFSKSKINFLR